MPEIVTLTVNPAIDIATSVERLTDTHKMRCAPVRCDPGGAESTSPALSIAWAGIASPSTLPAVRWPSDWRVSCRQRAYRSPPSGSKGRRERIFP